ncbi:hypothetical protein M0J74_RS19530 [Providencia rettgeri]|nr:hypothetical protein [Providencia rettgeri]
MKRNIDDFDGMKDFIISIIGAVAWFLIGAIVIIGYFTVETKGESIMLSYISTIFTIISSLGIAATIGVYFWQKKDAQDINEKKRKEKLLAYEDIYLDEKRKYKLAYKKFIMIRERLIKYDDITLKIRRRADIFIFLLYSNNKKRLRKYSFHFHENDLISLREASLKLIDIDIAAHKKAKSIIFAYSQLHMRLENLFIIYAQNNNKTIEINSIREFARKNNFKVDKIYNLAFNNPLH